MTNSHQEAFQLRRFGSEPQDIRDVQPDFCAMPHRLDRIQKRLGVHIISVCKIWFLPPPPPPKRAQNEEKLYKSVEDPQNWHFLWGGGNAILWTKRFYGHLDVSEECPRDRRDISTGQTGHAHRMVAVQKWGLSRRISLCLLNFSLPWEVKELRPRRPGTSVKQPKLRGKKTHIKQKKSSCPQGVLLERGLRRDFLEVAFSSYFLRILASSSF